MRRSQPKTNPFPFSDTNRRFYTYDYYLKHTFGCKVAKIPLDGGFTCPNIDGTRGFGGCIYCSERGGGDFAPSPLLSIAEQYEEEVKRLKNKWDFGAIIPYFQSHTNTYAPLAVLREKFEAALKLPGAVGLNIATRADCLADDVLQYLTELSHRTLLTVELGLQSANDKTAAVINRCHSYADFLSGYTSLRKASEKINICTHLIAGLPGETEADFLYSVREVAALKPEQVKIHLLHVLKGTRLEAMFKAGLYTPLEMPQYVKMVCDALELLPPETVIGRITGDGARDSLLAPDWSLKKFAVMNAVDKELYRRGTYQGIFYAGS